MNICDECKRGMKGMDNRIVMTPADESHAYYTSKEDTFNDRRLFVHNLGEVIKQTRDGVISVELDEEDIVTITYIGGGTHKVNVRCDSYAAIIRDVANHIQ